MSTENAMNMQIHIHTSHSHTVASSLISAKSCVAFISLTIQFYYHFLIAANLEHSISYIHIRNHRDAQLYPSRTSRLISYVSKHHFFPISSTEIRLNLSTHFSLMETNVWLRLPFICPGPEPNLPDKTHHLQDCNGQYRIKILCHSR